MIRNAGLLAIVLAWGLVGPASGQEWAQKMFDEDTHAFGTVARGAKAEHRFVFTNRYLEDLHVASVRSSCGCTSVRIDKPDLKTYEKSEIIATVNTKAFQGQKGATLTVTFDKPFYAEVQLHVSSFIRTDVVLEPGGVQFGTVDQGKPAEATVGVNCLGNSSWQITEVRSTDPNLSGEVVETRRAGGQVGYNLVAKLAGDAPVGYVNNYLILVTNDPNAPQIPVAVEGRITSDITVSPASLFMGVVPPGEKATKQLVVKASKPFRIVSITCDDKNFAFDTSDAESPKSLHLVPVTFSAGADACKITQKIRIETDQGNFTPELSAYAVVGNAGQ